MKAVLLCAGYATRLRPLTYYVSKAMIPVAGKPLVEHILVKLRDEGFEDFIICLSHLREQVEHYFGDGQRFGVRLQYSQGERPLNTAGEIVNARRLLEGEADFLVHYGDILTNLDIRRLLQTHRQKRAAATLGLVTDVPVHAGVAQIDDEGRVTYFEEKPPLDKPCHAAVNVFSDAFWKYAALDLDIATHVIPAMMAAGERVYGVLDEHAYWYDVGRLSDLDEVNKVFAASL